MDSVTRHFNDNNSSKNSVINVFFSNILLLFFIHLNPLYPLHMISHAWFHSLWNFQMNCGEERIIWRDQKFEQGSKRRTCHFVEAQPSMSLKLFYIPHFHSHGLGQPMGWFPDIFLWGETSITSRNSLLTIMRFETWPKSEFSNHSAKHP